MLLLYIKLRWALEKGIYICQLQIVVLLKGFDLSFALFLKEKEIEKVQRDGGKEL